MQKKKYELTEIAPADREYIEQIKCQKERLILQHEPELLGEIKDIPVPDKSFKTYINGGIIFLLCRWIFRNKTAVMYI